MRVVLGGSGQVGTALRALMPDALFPSRSELDLAQPEAIAPWIRAVSPSTVINCAAYTAVDAAESDPAMARTVNTDAVGALAAATADLGAAFVTYSTDYVFPGDGERPYVESDPTAPVNTYGATKLDGERRAVAANPATLIIRTSWVISDTHPNFVATMLRLTRDQTVRVVADQTGCPTIASDLAAATLGAVDGGVTGVLHLTNSGATTWFDLARTAVRMAGLPQERIVPCTTDEFPTAAPRPAYSVLGSERRENLGIVALPDWRTSIARVVAGQMGV